jgi:hypothetical protein
METQDFDLRYDDRVLAFHAYINTDRDPNVLGPTLQRTARGEKLEAQAAWLEGWRDGADVWDRVYMERNLHDKPALRYDGRLIVCHVFINTDRDPYHIQKQILRLARGDRLDACLVWSELYEGANGQKIWAEIQKVIVKVHASPKAVLFDASPSGGMR